MFEIMSANECYVKFDQNEHGTYLAGDLVTGKVIITSSQVQIITAIKLEICGNAHCAWKRKLYRNRQVQNLLGRNKKFNVGHEEYFYWETYLLGMRNGPILEIHPSSMSFNFAFQLPQNCPASFEGIYGYVRYFLKVSFVRTGAFDRTRLVGLTIQPLLDLNNENSLLKAPTGNETFENICYIGSHSVRLLVSLPRCAYALGEIIPVTVTVQNHSSFDCKQVIIMLQLCAKYSSQKLNNITEKITLVEKKCGPVSKKEAKTFVEDIRVPATPTSSEHLSKIIRISYRIHVVTRMNLFMNNASTKVPITIGNVPYNDGNEVAEQSNSPTSTVVDSGDGLLDSPSSSGRDSPTRANANVAYKHLSSITLPSYEESLFMRADITGSSINEVSHALPFVPHYPVFAVASPIFPTAPAFPEKKKKRRKRRKVFQNEEPPFEERLV